MQMTEGEIVREYRTAKNRTKQISILADLNECSKKTIREILERKGEQVPHYGNRYTEKTDSSKMSTRKPKAQSDVGINAQEVGIESELSETPEIVIKLCKERMNQINEWMKPVEQKLEELSREYNILKGWVELMEKGKKI